MQPKQGWLCNICGEAHDDEDDALDCCSHVIDGWLCPECGEFCYSSEDALACCDHDPDAPYLPTPQELEAAGQTRLF